MLNKRYYIELVPLIRGTNDYNIIQIIVFSRIVDEELIFFNYYT